MCCEGTRVETWGEDTSHPPPPPRGWGGMNDRPPVQAEGVPGPHPQALTGAKSPSTNATTSRSAGMFLSCTTCSRPVGGHTASYAQRHPQGTGGTAACLRPAFGCGHHVLPEVPFQPRTHLGRGHFCPRALSQQDRAAPRHQASCRWKDTWCILPLPLEALLTSPLLAALFYLITGAHPAVPPVPFTAATNEWRLCIYSHWRGLRQHPNAFMKKPLSASLPPPPTPTPPRLSSCSLFPSPPPLPELIPHHPLFLPPFFPPPLTFPPPLLAISLPPASLLTWPPNLSSSSHPAIFSQEPLPGHTSHPLSTISCKNSSAGQHHWLRASLPSQALPSALQDMSEHSLCWGLDSAGGHTRNRGEW